MASFVEERAIALISRPAEVARDGEPRRRSRGALMAMNPRKIGEGLYQPLAEINVTPLVDVMLVLLIIFMVTAPMLAAGIKVNLPSAKTAQPLEAKDPVIVAVTKDGAVSVGKDSVSRDDLVATVKARLADSNGVVQLRGDRDAAYGDVVSVMDDLAARRPQPHRHRLERPARRRRRARAEPAHEAMTRRRARRARVRAADVPAVLAAAGGRSPRSSRCTPPRSGDSCRFSRRSRRAAARRSSSTSSPRRRRPRRRRSRRRPNAAGRTAAAADDASRRRPPPPPRRRRPPPQRRRPPRPPPVVEAPPPPAAATAPPAAEPAPPPPVEKPRASAGAGRTRAAEAAAARPSRRRPRSRSRRPKPVEPAEARRAEAARTRPKPEAAAAPARPRRSRARPRPPRRGGGERRRQSAYMSDVAGAIRSRLFYPPAARARGAKGVVGVAFTIGASGARRRPSRSPAPRATATSTPRRGRWCSRRAFPAAAGRLGPCLDELQLCPALTPPRLRALVLGSGGGRRRAAMELRLPRLPPRLGRRQAREAAHASRASRSAPTARRWLLLNASIDLRQQILATPAMQPKGEGRQSPIAAVLLTNTDVDHAAGLLALRERQPFTIWGTRATLDTIGANRIFDVVGRDIVPRRAVSLGEPFEPLPGLTLELFPVPGKVPLWLEEGEVKTDEIGEGTVGVAVEAGGRRLVYAPGCARVTDDLHARIAGAHALFFDGTLFADDEMIAQRPRRQDEPAHGPHARCPGPGGTLEALARHADVRRILIHINNSNPILIEGSPEEAQVKAAGWEVAYDGMEVTPMNKHIAVRSR